jgi:RNA polymerase sigma-70 factor (ECF subfamily)
MEPQPETSDELALVAAVSAGSTDALATLYDRYSKTLMSLGMRVLKDLAEVEDLLHDVFVEVWEKAGSYDPARGSVRTWLCLRMRSRALDRCKLARRRRVDQLDDPDSLAKGQRDAVVAGSAPEVLGRDKLHEAINDLPDTQQMVISLAYFQGLSCSEIAANLDVPIGTVKSRLAGAKRGLQRAMGQSSEGAT